MRGLNPVDVYKFMDDGIVRLYDLEIEALKAVELSAIFRNKNPYRSSFNNTGLVSDLVQEVLGEFLFPIEEGLLSDFFAELAIFVCGRVYGGTRCSAEGIDLEFEKDHKRYIVSIKSGPNWGNSSQINKMKEDFTKAKRILRTTKSDIQTVAVNGCCYGRDPNPDKGEYFKYCGQMFWEFISGDSALYVNLIEPLGHKAKERNDEFVSEYSQIVNRFTLEFSQRFCIDGKIDWQALVRFNSSAEQSETKQLPQWMSSALPK